MEFEQAPDYQMLQQMLRKILEDAGKEFTDQFDWQRSYSSSKSDVAM